MHILRSNTPVNALKSLGKYFRIQDSLKGEEECALQVFVVAHKAESQRREHDEPHGNSGIVAAHYSVQQMKGVRVTEVRRLKGIDRKSTRLNSSHVAISYAVF